ncbi:MAG: hypothetical protein M9929_00575 [Burkholderiaceae bacterium]|nr:hypothetical protein [Burkholderiaceae bacterium]
MKTTDTSYKFKDYYLIWTSCIVFFVLVVHVLAEWAKGDVRMAWVAIAIWGGLLILRFFLVVVSPKEIYIFSSSRVLRIIPRKQWEKNIEISLYGLLRVDLSITIGRFPMVRVCLRFNDGRVEEIYFRPRVERFGFFSFYSEGVPEEVNNFVIELKRYEESIV